MKLSISNIAWSFGQDDYMYSFLMEQGFSGLEIAPTRIFPENPYDHLKEAEAFADMLKRRYQLDISSIQSIWYGRKENIFTSENDREALKDYTYKAIRFAEAVKCHNLVFGCPKNRTIPSMDLMPVAEDFFDRIGEFAADHNTVIALEPNPPYYNTNFINTTAEAFDFCRKLNCPGFKVNIDLGTMINYNESLDLIDDNEEYVNHIHISEPLLALILRRDLHKQLKLLNYNRFLSIEMKNFDNIELVEKTIRYVKEVLI